jgi:hypothetical protein
VRSPTRTLRDVFVHSGADGALLLNIQGPTDAQFGISLCGVRDMSGDDVPTCWSAARATWC